MMRTIRYESTGGRYWVEVDATPDEYGLVNYRCDNGLGYTTPGEFARMLASGYFQADKNVTPMKRVDES